jgi:hypothetical protein
MQNHIKTGYLPERQRKVACGQNRLKNRLKKTKERSSFARFRR